MITVTQMVKEGLPPECITPFIHAIAEDICDNLCKFSEDEGECGRGRCEECPLDKL